MPKEIGGPKGSEPTRYGDWEKTVDVLIFNIERGHLPGTSYQAVRRSPKVSPLAVLK
ncbi:MAG TPA: DUF1674 domain-containing protein [Rhodospirillales bacterium]|nr:DUF1674 domain-containing protein [Rhodospirillales bacterium]